MMDNWHDALGHHLGSVQDLDGGHHVLHDPLGRVVGHAMDLPDGSTAFLDGMGTLVGRAIPVGDGFQHVDTLGRVLFSEHTFGGHDHLQDALGRSLLQYDPCSGNLTNAIGQLVARRAGL